MKKKALLFACLTLSTLLTACNNTQDVPTESQTESYSESESESVDTGESDTESYVTQNTEESTEFPTEEPTDEPNLSWDEMTWHQIVINAEDYMGAEKLDKEFNGPHTDLSKWFADYNGEKIQRIYNAEDPSGPTKREDIIFYNTEESDVQSILKVMLDTMIQPLMEADEHRLYVITKYELEEPKLMQINENVWLIRAIDGYYSFEGEDGAMTMEELLTFETDIKDGMVRFNGVGSEGTGQYLLLKHGSIYRLQKASAMGGYRVEIE